MSEAQPIRTPRSTEAATALFARYAELDIQRAGVEAVRQADIGRINAAADAEVAGMVEQLDAMRAKLEAWFDGAGKGLLAKGRKSMQLGGCTFGTRSSSRLEHGFDSEDKAVEALQATRIAKLTLKVAYRVDRPAVKKLLSMDGRPKQTLGELGFRLEGGDFFFVDRVEQAGVMAPA